jgi:hypothetical protein
LEVGGKEKKMSEFNIKVPEINAMLKELSDNRPKTYKGKQVEYRGEISDRDSFEGKEEGIYYMISTGSFYCYYDGDGSLDAQFIPNPHNPEVAHMEPCWYSELKESEE